jgi:hypothetical protein
MKNWRDIYCVMSVKCHTNIQFTYSSIPNLRQFTTSTPKVGKFDITSKDFNRICGCDICFSVYDDCYVIN